MNKKSKEIICTDFSKGRKHDFKLFKDSRLKLNKRIKVITDTGYQGIKKFHEFSCLPKKKERKSILSQSDKETNRIISSERIIVENIICKLKVFKILSCRYRNRRKRFNLRFNLIAGVYNYELFN